MENSSEKEARLQEELEKARGRINELEQFESEWSRTRDTLVLGAEALRMILDNSRDIITILRSDGAIAYISPSVDRVAGYDPDKLMGTNAFDLIHPDDAAALLDAFVAGLEEPGQAINVEFRYRHADGSWHNMEAEGINLLQNPVVSGMILTSRDISDRKRMEGMLKESERYLRSLIENTLDIIVVIDGRVMIDFISPSLEHVLGYNPQDYIGGDPRDFLEVIHPEDVVKVTDFMMDSMRNPGFSGPMEFRIYHRDGRERIAETRANNLLEDPVIRGVVHTMRDITERSQAQAELQRRERYYRSLIRNAGDMVSIIDGDLTYRWGSRSAGRITGYGPEDIYGEKILEYVHPDDIERVKQEFDTIMRNQEVLGHAEVRFRHKDGSYHYHAVIANNLLDDPSVRGIVINSRDITERKLMEERLLASNRELDAFASTVSHDLRTPLSLIEGYAQLIQAEGVSDEEKRTYLESITHAVRRLDQLTESLLDYAQAGRPEGEIATVDPSEAIGEVLMFYTDAISRGGLEVRIDDDLPLILADPFKLRQVFSNLVDNAIKHGGDNAPLRIDIGASRDAGLITFYVRDNGVGIDPKLVEEVFLPFIRYGDSDLPGLGIGLSTVKRAVEGWGGMIWVESSAGGGTTFFFTAPAAD